MRRQQDTLGALLSASYRGWARAVNCHCHWIYTEPWDEMQRRVLPGWLSPNKHEKSEPLLIPLATCWLLPLPQQGQKRNEEGQKKKRKYRNQNMGWIVWCCFLPQEMTTSSIKIVVHICICVYRCWRACVSDLFTSSYYEEAETLPRPPHTFIKHPPSLCMPRITQLNLCWEKDREKLNACLNIANSHKMRPVLSWNWMLQRI